MRAYPAPDQEAIVRRIAMEEGVDPNVLVSIWQQESGKSTDLGLRGPVLPSGRWQGHYARGPFQIMSFHGAIPSNFEGQARWAAKHLKERGVRGYYGEGAPPIPGQPTTDQYERMVLARAGTPDVQQGLFQMSEPPAVGRAPQPEAQQMADDGLMGQGVLERLMGDPLFLMGASILANNRDKNVGQTIGRGLLGGSAAYQAMQASRENNEIRRAQLAKAQRTLQQDAMQQQAIKRAADQLRAQGRMMEADMLEAQMLDNDSASRLMGIPANDWGTNPTAYQRPDGSWWQRITNRAGEVRDMPLPGAPQSFAASEPTRAGQIAEAKQWGEMGPKAIGELGSTLLATNESLGRSQRLLSEFEAGKYDNVTGPIAGMISQYIDPDAAELSAEAMTQALTNLKITNLAPVSNYEISLIRQMFADVTRTPAQNKAILQRLINVQTAKRDVLRRALQRIREEGFQNYLTNPEGLSIDSIKEIESGRAGGAAQASSQGGRSATGSYPNAPPVGTVVDGYTFTGGNPADKANWTQVQGSF